MIKFKEYIVVVLAAVVPFFIAAGVGGIVIEWLFKSETIQLIAALVYTVLVTYPLIRWVFWISNKIKLT